MKNLKVRKYNPSLLDHASLITTGKDIFETYDLNNGYILKKIKERDKLSLIYYYQLDFFKSQLIAKLNASREIDLDSIVKPTEIFMHKEDIIGYTVPKIDGVSLDTILIDFVNDLDFISDILLELSREVKKANKEGICFPDIGNVSNVLIDKNKNKIKFIDYDGIQVFNHLSHTVSSFMSSAINTYFNRNKYINSYNGLVTSNLDKASLYVLFLYFTTNTVMTRFRNSDLEPNGKRVNIKKEAIDKYCQLIGIEGTTMEEDINRLFSTKSNKYPDTSIKRLVKDYKLEQYNGINRFIKK